MVKIIHQGQDGTVTIKQQQSQPKNYYAQNKKLDQTALEEK